MALQLENTEVESNALREHQDHLFLQREGNELWIVEVSVMLSVN